MSFSENDRKLQSQKGSAHPGAEGYDGVSFVSVMSEALRSDFGTAPSAVKRIARLTATNERAVRNWFEAKNGPSGENLVCLMQHSDAVFDAILVLCRRDQPPVTKDLACARRHIVSALRAIDASRPH